MTETESERIYLSPPDIGDAERRYVQEAFDTNWIAPLGPNVDAFEDEFCEVVDADYAAALSSGTAALHLALRLAGVGEGDEVVVPTLTFVASASPAVHLGAQPIFVDSERRSWNIDPNLLEDFLARRARDNNLPKALVAVHLYGQCADLDALVELCERYEITLIEDAAEALGASYRGESPGTFGESGIFSFNGNKIITSSGGGMLVSNDGDLIDKARKLATQARDPAPHYQHSELGYNYRMSNVVAGIGRGQLESLEQKVAATRNNFRAYRESLGDLPGVEFMPEADWGKHTRWLTCLTIEPDRAGVDREEVREKMVRNNIEARPVWKPMHLQPVFAGAPVVGGDVAGELFEKGLCLPSGSSLTDEQRRRVVDTFRSVFQ